eukprot:CAMPEP_0180225276 /NCGR_PEP_ID=MMETSP0987-20121128/22611_1 /TAXON_ID=697907 /ORGANISM="non described non described, Strain CCMP2293" /LENGTH=78 /DNA_ID=CAMNT_0022188327 /DNA_START=88 /DNA_END=324 /DNA_ORIENTATION=+
MTRTGPPTGTSAAPSWSSKAATYPSSCDSQPMVALSVSISQITSPGASLSPILTLKLAMLPVTIVGDSAGIARSVCAG